MVYKSCCQALINNPLVFLMHVAYSDSIKPKTIEWFRPIGPLVAIVSGIVKESRSF